MNSYPPISEHGLIGDLQTAALVSTGGTVDWLCLPRFDSPSVFASLLDADRGGRFRISPQDTNYVAKQLYFPDTARRDRHPTGMRTRSVSRIGAGTASRRFLPWRRAPRSAGRR